MQGLTAEQLEEFEKEGVLCIPNFLSEAQVSEMIGASHKLLSELDLENHPKTQFKTAESDNFGDQYFFESSDKISYFFDVDAFDEEGKLQFPKEKAVNKIGHALHKFHPLFHDISFGENVKSIARDLGYQEPKMLQSMLIFKNPVDANDGKADARDNAVPSHTDGTFLFTEPHSAVGFWFALEDCTPTNGCLSYNPGSHKTFPITKRFVKLEGGSKGCGFADVPVGTFEAAEDNPEDYKLVECQAGSLVLIHNSVLHKSEKNISDKSRFAYTFHLIEGTCKYDEQNWLQVPATGGSEFSKLYED